MTDLTTKAKEFCAMYFIHILSMSKRVTIARTKPITALSDETGIGKVDYTTEPLITVDIPLGEIEHLAELDRIFYNNSSNIHQRRVFNRWIENEQAEAHLRKNNAALKLAYEHYQSLLVLAKDHSTSPIDIS